MSSKDAYYFKHDSNAKDDPKCILLIEELGLEGYGIFWVLIETLRDEEDFRAPLRIVPALARRYNTSAEKVKAVIRRYDLFIIEENEFFFSESLIKRMEPLIQKKYNAKIAGIKGSLVRYGYCSKEEAGRLTDKEIIEAQEKINALGGSDRVAIGKLKPSYSNKRRKEQRREEQKKEYSATELQALEICKYLVEMIVKHNPDHKYASNPPALDSVSWMKEVDRAIRLDGRTEEGLRNLITYTFTKETDSAQFWSGNIQSGSTLRKHYDKAANSYKREKSNRADRTSPDTFNAKHVQQFYMEGDNE